LAPDKILGENAPSYILLPRLHLDLRRAISKRMEGKRREMRSPLYFLSQIYAHAGIPLRPTHSL